MKGSKILSTFVIMAVLACCLITRARGDEWYLTGQTIVEEPKSPDEIWFSAVIEDRILEITNEIRDDHGLKKVGKDEGLRNISRMHSADMTRRDFFAHNNPDGLSPFDRIAIEHRTFIGTVAENIYYVEGYDLNNPEAIVSMLMTGWMNSPPHRANILGKDYNYLGVGVAVRNKKVTATQNFGNVYAYLDNPLPKKVHVNDFLDLKVTPDSPTAVVPDKVDFIKVKSGRKVAGPFNIPGAKADIKPGTYDLRFYFPDDEYHWTIVGGPRIEVVK